MGRGRTTTGMIVASLIATIEAKDMESDSARDLDDEEEYEEDRTEATQYQNG